MTDQPKFDPIPDTVAALAPAKRQRWPWILGGVLGVLAAIWSGLWYVTAQKIEARLDQQAAKALARGQNWQCGSRTLSGFPFGINVTCEQPKVTHKRPDGGQAMGALARFSAQSTVFDPKTIVYQFSGPMTIEGPEKGNVVQLGWQRAGGTYTGDETYVQISTFEMEGVEITFNSPTDSTPQPTLRLARLALAGRPMAEAPGSTLGMELKELRFAPLDEASGNNEPFGINLHLDLPGYTFNPSLSNPEHLIAWGKGGKPAHFKTLRFSKGPLDLEMSGDITLDALHRPQGEIRGKVKGLEAVSKRSGIDLGALARGMGGPDGVPFVLALSEGWLRYGPFQLVPLKPLY